MILYFNPECSKCNEALDLLNKNSCEVEIRNYLQTPPSADELRDLVKKLGCRSFDIVRQKEPLFQEKFAGKQLSDGEWLRVLSENPVLIERPIVVSGEKALIGRPPVKVLDILPDRK